MTALSGKPKRIAVAILEMLGKRKSLKLDAENGFMPLHVERVVPVMAGTIYSFAHYYEQNGDLMRDPDMEFLVTTTKNEIIPINYRQDGLGIFNQAVIWGSDGSLRGVDMDKQRRLAEFAQLWMRNLNLQQRLGVK